MSVLTTSRNDFHKNLLQNEILTFSPFSKYDANNICSNADNGQKHSVQVANLIANKISENLSVPVTMLAQKKSGQTLGNAFEATCTAFLQNTFLKLDKLRPGTWVIEQLTSRSQSALGKYEQYTHLAELSRLASTHPELKNFLGDGYTVSPDIIIARTPETDTAINARSQLIDEHSCLHTMLRSANHTHPNKPTQLLHASISCKFTMRSDRAQNTRTEALNLIRARKGQTPHIVSVTAEPTVSRIASLALGTGDLDCVYHFALYELQASLETLGADDALEQLTTMVDGKRLKDISDLPMDLAI